MRRSPEVAEVLPVLYLRKLSTGDFKRACGVAWVADAVGVSAINSAPATAVKEAEYRQFRNCCLREHNDVEVWADGIHFNVC